MDNIYEVIRVVGFFGVFMTSFMMSFGHCTGMCGPIVLSYSTIKLSNDKVKSGWHILEHFLYNLGRICSYTALGAIAGFIGSIFTLNSKVMAFFFMFMGAFIILLAILYALGLQPKVNIPLLNPKGKGLFARIFSYLFVSQSLPSFFGIGILNGLIPCGMVYMYLATAAAYASPLSGAMAMLAFGLGTFCAMFLMGIFASVFLTSRLRKYLLVVALVMMVGMGYYTILKGYKIYKNPMDMSMHSMHMDMGKGEGVSIFSFKRSAPKGDNGMDGMDHGSMNGMDHGNMGGMNGMDHGNMGNMGGMNHAMPKDKGADTPTPSAPNSPAPTTPEDSQPSMPNDSAQGNIEPPKNLKSAPVSL